MPEIFNNLRHFYLNNIRQFKINLEETIQIKIQFYIKMMFNQINDDLI